MVSLEHNPGKCLVDVVYNEYLNITQTSIIMKLGLLIIPATFFLATTVPHITYTNDATYMISIMSFMFGACFFLAECLIIINDFMIKPEQIAKYLNIALTDTVGEVYKKCIQFIPILEIKSKDIPHIGIFFIGLSLSALFISLICLPSVRNKNPLYPVIITSIGLGILGNSLLFASVEFEKEAVKQKMLGCI